ncbi:tetraspanin-15-like [Mangifera indica]|uniref:tetraspanin-15-like n=1 Tax=Mangifera indica TaxID=29780 RepID=UPI001CF9C363|nr:tetraspanin-15-like [Mangifera indica]
MADKTAAAEAPLPPGGPKAALVKAKVISGLLTMLSFILSLPVLASVIWLLYMRESDCESLLRLPQLQFGIGIALIFMFIICIASLVLSRRFPMPGFLLVMVPLLVMLVVGLALVGAYDLESRRIPASPKWLRSKVTDPLNWNYIKTCIYETKICDDLFSRSISSKSYDFSMSKLSSIEAGCCKPPSVCQMEFVNATFWRKNEATMNDSSAPCYSDCDIWGNDRTILCYSCQACKDGFLSTLRSKWWKFGLFLVLIALLLIVSHLLLFIATMLERFAV